MFNLQAAVYPSYQFLRPTVVVTPAGSNMQLQFTPHIHSFTIKKYAKFAIIENQKQGCRRKKRL